MTQKTNTDQWLLMDIDLADCFDTFLKKHVIHDSQKISFALHVAVELTKIVRDCRANGIIFEVLSPSDFIFKLSADTFSLNIWNLEKTHTLAHIESMGMDDQRLEANSISAICKIAWEIVAPNTIFDENGNKRVVSLIELTVKDQNMIERFRRFFFDTFQRTLDLTDLPVWNLNDLATRLNILQSFLGRRATFSWKNLTLSGDENILKLLNRAEIALSAGMTKFSSKNRLNNLMLSYVDNQTGFWKKVSTGPNLRFEKEDILVLLPISGSQILSTAFHVRFTATIRRSPLSITLRMSVLIKKHHIEVPLGDFQFDEDFQMRLEENFKRELELIFELFS